MRQRIRVVVVDDDPDFRYLLRTQLGMLEGFEVVASAGDGIEALEEVDRVMPDVVAMDLLMPRMNGFEAIEELQRRHPELPVIAYTAVAGAYVRDVTQRLGVELVLKTGDQTDLIAAIERAVARGAPPPDAIAGS